MSTLYSMIENQINLLLRFFLETDEGEIRYTDLLSGPKQIKAFITLLSALLFIVLVIFFGLYLWNQGLQPVFPSVISPIGLEKPFEQSKNPFFQLILTLIALTLVF